MKITIATILLLGAGLAWAENHQVMVGAGGFVFTPNTLTANPGDTVEFIVTGV